MAGQSVALVTRPGVPHFNSLIEEESCRCRARDQENTSPSVTFSGRHYAQTSSSINYPVYSGYPEPRDISPRASPSRPNSTHFSPPATPTTTSAISALRSLSIRPPSPPSPTGGAYQTSIWPFSRSAATSPSTSYTRPVSGVFSSTFDESYYSSVASGGYAVTMDRPLPMRRPGIYARPKSIELVTPMVGR
jgi:hypothetical protein